MSSTDALAAGLTVTIQLCLDAWSTVVIVRLAQMMRNTIKIVGTMRSCGQLTCTRTKKSSLPFAS